jgi:PQQ-like domain
MPRTVPTFTFQELTIWRSELPNVQNALLPASNSRPNPLLAGHRLFASICNPGAICALRAEDGELLWRREIPKLAAASVYVNDPHLLAQSSHTLHSLDQDSGEILWSFSPHGTERETMYSSPTVYQGRVYIGDRRGLLHCLDVRSGETIWSKETNQADNDDVNSTPLIFEGLVIVTTNAATAVAYNTVNADLVWEQQLDRPSVFGPLVFKERVAAVANSLYLLDGRTGTIERRFKWKNDAVRFAECSTKTMLVGLRGPWPPEGNAKFIWLNESGIRAQATREGFCFQPRYIASTGLMYLSHLEGIDLWHAETGDVLCRINAPRVVGGDTGLPDAKDHLYVLTGEGHLYALKHPQKL